MESGREEVKLLLIRSSPFAMSCALALREKGVKFEEVQENLLPPKTDRLLRSNPVYKQVPVLIHNGKPVSQSLIILEYIEEACTRGSLAPFRHHALTFARLRLRQVARSILGGLRQQEGRPLIPLLLCFLPACHSDASLVFCLLLYVPGQFIETGLKLMKRFGEEHATARKEIVEQFISMEEGMRAIGSVGPYFLGDKMTLADMALAPLVPWLPSFEALGELKFPGPEKCGRMHKWLDAMSELPNVVASVPPADWLLQYTASLRQFIAEHDSGGA